MFTGDRFATGSIWDLLSKAVIEFTNCGTWFAGSVEKLRRRRINPFGYDRGMVSLAPHRILQHRSSSVDSASGHQYYYQFPVFQFSRL